MLRLIQTPWAWEGYRDVSYKLTSRVRPSTKPGNKWVILVVYHLLTHFDK